MKVTFSIRTPKKHSVRFDSTDRNAPIKTIYITNSGDVELGSPEKITVEISPEEKEKKEN